MGPTMSSLSVVIGRSVGTEPGVHSHSSLPSSCGVEGDDPTWPDPVSSARPSAIGGVPAYQLKPL
jgi:hypothetical protein